jgi:hypothetical protein
MDCPLILFRTEIHSSHQHFGNPGYQVSELGHVCRRHSIRQQMAKLERLNQTIEAFLGAYVNHQQNDWVELLPPTEFAYNNTIMTIHGMTPFYANYGYHPSSGSAPPGSNTLLVHSIAYGHWMKAIYEDCNKELEKTSDRMKKYADKTRAESPRYNQGDLVMLNGKNIKTRRPSRKLDHKLYGPFEILDP